MEGVVVAEDGIPGISSPKVDKIAEALAKAQGEVGAVTKNSTAKAGSFEFDYASLDAVCDAIRPIASKNGLSVIQRFKENVLHTVLVHSSGQWIDYGDYPLGQAVKHQERGSAITYARRYTISCVFGVAPEDDDGGEKGNDSLGGGMKAVDKAKREQYKAAKDKYVIDLPTLDGKPDYDAFAADLELSYGGAASMNDVSMLTKANARVLNILKTERPELFSFLKDLAAQCGNKFA